MKKNGFTLIELLAVIIILAVIALIATPLVINVVTGAKAKANEASIYGYADGLKLAVYDYMYKEDTFGQKPNVDKTWAEANMELNNKEVSCEGVFYNETYSSVLNKCKVSDSEKEYCLAKGKIYECDNSEFTTILGEVGGIQTSGNFVSTLLGQYVAGNTTGLVQDSTNTNLYYYRGNQGQVSNNFLWYGGHQWRIMEIDSTKKTLTLITQQPVTAISPGVVWTTQEMYENGAVNKWLNNYFWNSLDSSVRNNIKDTTFNVGIYNPYEEENQNATELQTIQKVGLLDGARLGPDIPYSTTLGYLTIDDCFLLGNRQYDDTLTVIHSNNYSSISKDWVYGVRPVIKISDITIVAGSGTLTDNYRTDDKSTNTNDIKVGEYINVPTSGSECGSDNMCTFRVVSKDNDSVKVILNGLLPSKNIYGTTSTITTSHSIYTPLNSFANTIDSKYRYVQNKIFYIGKYDVQDKTLSANVGLPTIGEMFSGNDIDVTDEAKTFVDINTIENPKASPDFWTMNESWEGSAWGLTDYGYAYSIPVDAALGIRPVIFLNKGTSETLTFTSGIGTPQSPYVLSN